MMKKKNQRDRDNSDQIFHSFHLVIKHQKYLIIHEQDNYLYSNYYKKIVSKEHYNLKKDSIRYTIDRNNIGNILDSYYHHVEYEIISNDNNGIENYSYVQRKDSNE